MVYHKLVRDKIPQIIESSGKKCTTEILTEDAYLQKLDEKLSEELAEYQQSKSLEELEPIRVRKNEHGGGFEERILLIESV